MHPTSFHSLLMLSVLVINGQDAGAAPEGMSGRITSPTTKVDIPRFVPERVLTGYRLPKNAWAPDADKLLLQDARALYLLDLRIGGGSPRPLLSGRVTDVAWAPRGNAVVCRLQPASEVLQNTADLLLVPLDGSRPRTILRRARFTQVLCTEQGSIFILDAASRSPRRVGPQLAGDPSRSATARMRGQRLVTPGTYPTGDRLVLPGASTPPPIAVSPNGHGMTFVQDVFPDGRHLLLWAQRPEWQTIIADPDGHALQVLAENGKPHYFAGTSVTHDGVYVLGDASRDSAETTAEAWLVIMSPTWGHGERIPGAPRGASPQASRTSHRIAFHSQDAGGVGIGRLIR